MQSWQRERERRGGEGFGLNEYRGWQLIKTAEFVQEEEEPPPLLLLQKGGIEDVSPRRRTASIWGVSRGSREEGKGARRGLIWCRR